MKKTLIVLLLLFILLVSSQLVQAEESFVNTAEAEAVLDLMDGISAGKVTNREGIITNLKKIYDTEGYHTLCSYHDFDPHKNRIMNRIYKVCWSIIHGQTEELKGYELYYYDIYKNREKYRQFLQKYKDWTPSDDILEETYSYFPERKPFTGTIYFVVDEYSDGYTPAPDMVFSIYQIKKIIEEKGLDFNREIFAHEFHHILTKELLLEKYGERVLNSADLTYFLGYIMLEGYAVEATADEDTKNDIYRLDRTDDEIYNLFTEIEKVIQIKGKKPARHWRSVYREHLSKMVDIYTVGTTMVQVIEKKFGRDVLINALENPPQFFRLYQKAAEDNEELFAFQKSTMTIIEQAFSDLL